MIKRKQTKKSTKRKNPTSFIDSRKNAFAANRPIIGIKKIGILQKPMYIIDSGDSDLPISIVEYDLWREESDRVYSLAGTTPAAGDYRQYQLLKSVLQMVENDFIRLGPKYFEEKYFLKKGKISLDYLLEDPYEKYLGGQ
jgi:hypothetical protein